MSTAFFNYQHKDTGFRSWHYPAMSARKHMRRDLHWYLEHWMAATQTKQRDLVLKTGWSAAKASLLVNGRMDYTPETLKEAADALNIRIFELFMLPEDAFHYRSYRETAVKWAADSHRTWTPEPINLANLKKTGT
jgi:transcriptional regulator with XRE-family HTH domain